MIGWERLARHIGLWPRLGLSLSAGFLALFLVFSALSERAIQESIARLLEERQLLAEMAAGEFEDLFAHAGREIHGLSQGVPSEALRSEWLALAYRRQASEFGGLLFLDAAGRLQAAYPPWASPREHRSWRSTSA